MDKRISESLSDNYASVMNPFFWQHGEPRDVLLREIEAIEGSGIREFCVESRTYEKFCEDEWWGDFGFMLAEAKKRGMRVWLLDDKHFPTGHANDVIKHGDPRVRKLLREEHTDVTGPRPGVSFLAGSRLADGETLLCAVAYRRDADENMTGERIDLTSFVDDGIITFDVPEGFWRIFYLIGTSADVPNVSGDPGYVDMLTPESARTMIDAVYEPHFERFGEYFGNTFAGFFSDEPCFNNERYSYRSMLGKRKMVIPWRADLPELAGFELADAPALWFRCDGLTPRVRTAYMDAVTKLYKENFCDALGDWCRAHKVEYIGHVIEDMNTHMRLGYGTGHYFRALWGQDMAGIDVVLHQYIPGITDGIHQTPVCDDGLADPEFNNYLLAKLGASLAHIDPKKRGRCMLEIFGAFGWAEGMPFMKSLADHFLANGVNFFVPHAFTPKYPDPDCPPHFYAAGMNPQYEDFAELMKYMSRTAHALSGGVHRADAILLYNPDGEWSGGGYTFMQNAARQMTRAQIDFDIVPPDVMVGDGVFADGAVHINGETYGAIVSTRSEYLSRATLDTLRRAADAGVPVIIGGALPRVAEDCSDAASDGFTVVPEDKIAGSLRGIGVGHISCASDSPLLRFYHVSRDGNEIVMFHSEDAFAPYDGVINTPFTGGGAIIDMMTGETRALRAENGSFRLTLPPEGSAIVCFGDVSGASEPVSERPERAVEARFDIDVKSCTEDEYRPLARGSELFDVTGKGRDRRFCGLIRYRASLALDGTETVLSLGKVGETARVTLNGEPLGTRICAPYSFNVAGKVRPGANTLEIVCANSPAYRERDRLSGYIWLEPSGVIGPVTVR